MGVTLRSVLLMARPTRLAAATLFLAACSDRPAPLDADTTSPATAPSAQQKKDEVVAKKVFVADADGSVEGDEAPAPATNATDVPVIRLTLSNLASALGE